MFVYRCPGCEKETRVERREDAPFRPFCSERCKLVDLGRWLDGTYVISEQSTPEELTKDLPENDG